MAPGAVIESGAPIAQAKLGRIGAEEKNSLEWKNAAPENGKCRPWKSGARGGSPLRPSPLAAPLEGSLSYENF